MTDQEALMDLAERCEKATGADREIDREIAIALSIGPHGRSMPPETQRYEEAYPNMPADRKEHYRRAGYLRSLGSPDGHFGWSPVAFTASLDAAMTLVPEGWFMMLDGEPGCILAEVALTANPSRTRVSKGATLALALTAACLRARATQTAASTHPAPVE
jgi:hypothetical protein